MFTSIAQQEFRIAVKEFSNLKFQEIGSYAYSAGYLESLVVNMFASLSKKEQKFYLQQMQEAVDKQTA